MCRVESEEQRSTQMTALHLARKSGNSALSQVTWSSPLANSCVREDGIHVVIEGVYSVHVLYCNIEGLVGSSFSQQCVTHSVSHCTQVNILK